ARGGGGQGLFEPANRLVDGRKRDVEGLGAVFGGGQRGVQVLRLHFGQLRHDFRFGLEGFDGIKRGLDVLVQRGGWGIGAFAFFPRRRWGGGQRRRISSPPLPLEAGPGRWSLAGRACCAAWRCAGVWPGNNSTGRPLWTVAGRRASGRTGRGSFRSKPSRP